MADRSGNKGMVAESAVAQPIRVPLNRPTTIGDEWRLMAEAAASGRVGGGGPFTAECEARLEALTGARRALLTTSASHALELAALLLEIEPGDEVVVPSFTFTTTASSFVLRGARPVFVDIRPDTLNLDEAQLASALTPRTRAIVPVHYAGVACEMDAIGDIAAAHGIPVVEDNAHGLSASYRGRPLGSHGALGVLSFHETKNITCGEGGALLINDAALVERAEVLRDKGTNRSRFLRGDADRYTWIDLGSSYLPADLLAAFLAAQLRQADRIQATRRALWDRYHDELGPWAEEHGASLPVVPAHVGQSFHLFYMLLPSTLRRDALIEFLRVRGIQAAAHYPPLHSTPFGRQSGQAASRCPVAEDVSQRLIRLPLFTGMTGEEIGSVIAAVQEFA